MKNIIISLLLVTVFLSCTDESLNPMPEITTMVGLVRGERSLPEYNGGYLKIDIDEDEDGIIDNVFNIHIESPQDNVDSFTIMGKIADFTTNPNAVSFGDYIPIKTITEFPSDMIITQEELAAAFGLEPSDFSPPNHKFFKYIGVSDSNGITVNLDMVTGAGFSSSDDGDGISSGLTTMYQESKRYVIYYQ